MLVVGIVAGWGEYPIKVAKALRQQGHRVVIAAVRDHAAHDISQFADATKWVGVCKLGAMQRFFAEQNVDQVCLSGKLFKDKILFHGWGWVSHLPDWECTKTMFPLIYSRVNNTSDDSLLGAVVRSFEQKGMTTVPGTNYAKELLAEPGVLTRRKPTAKVQADIEFGWKMAKAMGQLDVGQSVIVRDRTVLSVEAVEGTDACIARTAQICPRGGFTMVKVAKPQQDMRFDLPTIGPQTIEVMRKAGGRAIAIEANKTILIDREKTLADAHKANIVIVSILPTEA